jgi:hypothetical protein
MKAYIRFTQAWLDSDASRGTKGRTVEYRDGGQAGLSLRVHPSGSRVFCVVGSIRGAGKGTTRVSLGNADRVKLPVAREEARKVLEAWALGRQYETPAAEARRKENERREAKRATAREMSANAHLAFERVLDAYSGTHLLGMKSGNQVRDLLVRVFGPPDHRPETQRRDQRHQFDSRWRSRHHGEVRARCVEGIHRVGSL